MNLEAAVAGDALSQGQTTTHGAWQLLSRLLPFSPAHAALLPTGKVLFLPGTSQNSTTQPSACLWDPATQTSRTWGMAVDFSLGGHCPLPDGRVLLTAARKPASSFRSQETFLFDPFAEEWIRVNDLPDHGPCPTLVQLDDGSVAAVGGTGGNAVHVYDKTNGWVMASSQDLPWPLYPQLTLLEDGSIFYSGQHFGGRALLGPGVFRPDEPFVELGQPAAPYESREQGTTVLLPPAQDQRVLVAGGGSVAQPDAYIMDFSGEEGLQQPISPPNVRRSNFNSVVLPNRTVVVLGGSHADGGRITAVREAEIFDPATERWRMAAPADVARLDHCCAVLLPDGTVLTAGSTSGSGKSELRLERYHPPYVFRRARPRLEVPQSEIVIGESFVINTTDSDIGSVSLVRPTAASHGVDSGQRLVDLPFDSVGIGKLQANVPGNPNLVPPGWYLLFLINHKGTPSEGSWVHVNRTVRAPGSTAAPTLTAVPSPPARVMPERNGRPAPERNGIPAERVFKEPTTSPPYVPQRMAPAPVAEPAPAEPATPATLKSAADLTSPPLLAPPAAPETSVAAGKPAAGTAAAAPPLDQATPVAGDSVKPEASSPKVQTPAPAVQARPEPAAARIEWRRWSRPALIIGSAGLLALSMLLEVAPLRAATALLFLLFAPGMALVGLFSTTGWASEISLSMGLSIALETLLAVAFLYLGTWSAETIFLIVLAISMAGAVIQLFLAAFGRSALFEQTRS